MTLLEDTWTDEDHAEFYRLLQERILRRWLAVERTPDDWVVAYHEAGHAMAAVLCGVQWTSATIVPGEGFDGRVRTEEDHDTSANNFILWAGSYAESRYTDRPLAEVLASSGAHDLRQIRGVVPKAEWSAHMDLAWPLVERFAAQLIDNGTLLAGSAKNTG